MTKSMRALRDYAAKQYWKQFSDKDRWDVYGDFNAGFDAGVAIMLAKAYEKLKWHTNDTAKSRLK